MIRNLRANIAELGGCNALLWSVGRGFGRLGLPIRFIRYYFVAQPVPDRPVLGERRGRKIAVRRLAPGDTALAQLPLTRDVLDYRFGQDAVCFAAFNGAEVLGCLWFCFGTYREDEVRCLYRLQPGDATAWDFDVYVAPPARGTYAFLRLWDEANTYLRSRGAHWSLSRISAFNPASLAAHARLGARRTGSALFLLIGSLQVTFLRRPPWLHLSGPRGEGPEIPVRAPDTQ